MIWRTLLFLFFSFPFFLNAQVTHTFTGQGDGINWHDNANWDTGTIPSTLDNVIIPATFEVVIAQANTFAREVTLKNKAKLTVNNSAIFNAILILADARLAVHGDMEIGLSSDLRSNTLVNHGTVANSGTIELRGAFINFAFLLNGGTIDLIETNTSPDFHNKSSGHTENGEFLNFKNIVNDGFILNFEEGNINSEVCLNRNSLFNRGTIFTESLFNEIEASIDDGNTFIAYISNPYMRIIFL